MKTSALIGLLLFMVVSIFGISSNTNSAVFTMDTIAPIITITTPNGGELWYIGDTNNILWSATDTNISPNSVYLWYTLNGGTAYTSLVAGTANTGSYPWQLPEIQSYNAKVRIQVADSFGNISQKTSDAAFSITYVPPDSPDNVQIDISNNIDAVITWQPVTETVYSTPITPDGYMVLYNETPYEDKDFDGRLAEILSERDPAQQLSLADIKAKLQARNGGDK
jgi:hypothetical protein